MVTLIILGAGAFALAGIVTGGRAFVRRRRANLERRRLASLGSVDGHREYPR